MANLPQTGAPEWAGSEASPWNTVGRIGRTLDAFATRSIVETRGDLAPPVSCADGARYLIDGVGSGLWLGHDGQLAIAVGTDASNGWYFAIVENEGTQLYVRDEAVLIEFLSGVWALAPDRIVANLSGINDGDILYYDLSAGLFYPGPAQSISGYIDTDGTLAANSDLKIATQKATKTYVDSAVVGLLDYKGAIDCSANPNYPAASKGDAYVVSVAGKVGGASGKDVEAGDFVFAKADNAGGTEASVGSSWDILQFNATAYALLSGATFSGSVAVPDDPYDATGWNGSTNVPTKNAVRDKIESLALASGSYLIQGTHTIPVPAGAMTARTTSGAAAGTTESTTNKVMTRTLDFDDSTVEYAQVSIAMPKSWDEGTVTCQFIWTATNTGNAVWGAQAQYQRDDDALDAAWGTAQTVTDSVTAANDRMISAFTSAITPAGTGGSECSLLLQFYRDAAAGGDTLTGDAKLIAVRIKYTINASDDS